MLTRKHFKMIAETLAKISDKATMETLISEYCSTLKAENPRFDAMRFRNYIAERVAL